MASEAARVVLLGLDGFPSAVLIPEVTPRLCELAARGGQALRGGRCSLPSTTYPGFASLLTGLRSDQHGVWCTALRRRPAWAGADQVQAPTLFDSCDTARRSSAAMLGDYLLYDVIRAGRADLSWPVAGRPPVDTDLDAHGYATNDAVRSHLLEAVADGRIDFVFGQLNEVDTFGHDYGPQHPRTIACCMATDALIGEVVHALEPLWERTVLIVVSDHDMVDVTDAEPIDLMQNNGVVAVSEEIWPDGGGALVRVRDGMSSWAARAALLRSEGVAGVEAVSDRVIAVGADGGRVFRRVGGTGVHGGASTLRTLAVVGGGHPVAQDLAARIRFATPHLADWASSVAQALGLETSEWAIADH